MQAGKKKTTKTMGKKIWVDKGQMFIGIRLIDGMEWAFQPTR
jgi:hypothetical protein